MVYGASGRLDAEPENEVHGALVVRADGMVGRVTLQALTAHPRGAVLALCGALHDAQPVYYRVLDGFGRFGGGWTARVGRRLKAAVGIVTA